jgi:hypothetical protein
MSGYGGFIHILDEENRAELLREVIKSKDRFTEAVSRSDWKPKQVEIFLLSLDGETLNYAALAKKTGRPVTGKDRLELSRFVRLQDVGIAEVQKGINRSLTHHFSRATSGGGTRVPPATWLAVINYLSEISPAISEGLAHLERLRLGHAKGVHRGKEFQVAVEEKDATMLALNFAGFEREDFLRTFDATVAVNGSPLFSGIRSAVLLEDQMIAHDKSVFEGWNYKGNLIVGATQFSRGGETLSIVNANRTKTEEVVGVDLVYHHQQADLFVMVQYKRLMRESTKNNEEDRAWCYRPDRQCSLEQARMEKFIADFPDSWNGDPTHGYRLLPVPFFFKLCKSETLDPFSPQLISGFYVPLDNWQRLVGGSAKGPKGGIRIDYDNAKPYLTNSLFTQLVTARLVGSRGLQTDQIRRIVEESVNAKRSVVVAELLKTNS